MYDAKEYGSIVRAEQIDCERIYRRLEEIREQNCADLYDTAHRNEALEKLLRW
jgi:hypothetical protein